MSLYWRHLLLTVVLAGLAGFAGAWLGVKRLAPQPTPPPMLPMIVRDMTERGLKNLTSTQQQQLAEIDTRFDRAREQLRLQITAANFDLANSLAEEMSLGPNTQESIRKLEVAVGELQKRTVVYVLDLRNVLSPDQQLLFDARVVEALMSEPR